jgi:hypothetical protein
MRIENLPATDARGAGKAVGFTDEVKKVNFT